MAIANIEKRRAAMAHTARSTHIHASDFDIRDPSSEQRTQFYYLQFIN